MKKFLFVLLLPLMLIGCGNSEETEVQKATVDIIDDGNFLSPEQKEYLISSFDSIVNYNIKIYISTDTLTYSEAAKDKAKAGPQLFPFEYKYSVAISYYPANKRLFVSVDGLTCQNEYDIHHAVTIYKLQRDAEKYSDIEILHTATMEMADMIRHSNWTQIASSIYSVVDFLNQELIMPSDNVLHYVIFRIPLYVSLSIVHCLGSLGWSIVIILLLYFVWLYFYSEDKVRHGCLLNLLNIFQLLVLTCTVVLFIPSYETVMGIHNLGFEKVASVLDQYYYAKAYMGRGWIAAIFFCILCGTFYAIKGISTYDPNDSTQDNSQEVEKCIGMMILSFFFPKPIVWAVNAYFVQKILTTVVTLSKIANNKLTLYAASEREFRGIILGLLIYFSLLLCWGLCYVDWTWLYNIEHACIAWFNHLAGLWLFLLFIAFITIFGLLAEFLYGFVWEDYLRPAFLDMTHLIAFGCHTAEEYAKQKKAIKNVLLFGSIFYIIHLVVIILLIAYLQALLF